MTGRAIAGADVSMLKDDLRVATGGMNGMVFSPLIPREVRQAYRGREVTISVEGMHFSVTVGEDIRLPLRCESVREARDLVMSVSMQIMTALLESVTRRDPVGMPMAAEEDPTRLSAPTRGAAEDLTFSSLFADWSRAHLMSGGAPTTPPYWKVLIERFEAFLGHDDPRLVTSQDLRRYRDHLIAGGRKLRTARHADFAALRALFHFAVENQLVNANPTIGVRFRGERLASADAMRAFSDHEARTILAAADREMLPSRRWIPWLTALTGSRVAAIANLRRQDVVEIDGIWCLRISREAGPIKTAASERIVPIHPAILERGFISFVDTIRRERLFVEKLASGEGPTPGAFGDGEGGEPYNPARSTIWRLTEWLHTLDLPIGRAAKKDPNHAWRHWFKEQAFAVGIPEKITDAIVGHAQATTSRRYGSVSLAVMDQELRKIRSPV